jgi:hypothetical protein
MDMFLGGGACADPVRNLRALTNPLVGVVRLGPWQGRSKRPTDRSAWTAAGWRD